MAKIVVSYKGNPLLIENSELSFGMPFTTLSSKTFQALFDYATIGILITNSKGEIQSANKFIEHHKK